MAENEVERKGNEVQSASPKLSIDTNIDSCSA